MVLSMSLRAQTLNYTRQITGADMQYVNTLELSPILQYRQQRCVVSKLLPIRLDLLLL